MKKIQYLELLSAITFFLFTTNAHAYSTTVIDLGDTTIENVQTGNTQDPTLENLEYWFGKNGITNTDGSAIDPKKDQLQSELFFTNVTRSYQIEFLGIGLASYHSPFGVFSYAGNPYAAFDQTKVTYGQPLFIQNEVPKNSVYEFSIAAGSYFGFYLDSNRRFSKTGNALYLLTSMVAANKDKIDHAIFFKTNKGYTIAFEDIPNGGDRDYEDLVINFKPTDGSGFSPVPEPSSVLLLGTGVMILVASLRKKYLQQ